MRGLDLPYFLCSPFFVFVCPQFVSLYVAVAVYAGHCILVSLCRCSTGVPAADHLINSASHCSIKPRLIYQESVSLPHNITLKSSSSLLVLVPVCTLLILSLSVLQVHTPVCHSCHFCLHHLSLVLVLDPSLHPLCLPHSCIGLW